MTENNLTFEGYDKFHREPFADRLTEVITKFYPFIDGAYVLSLNAKFGSGKSTFLEMWRNKLTQDGYTVIDINAWKTDFDEEPIIPIASAFLDSINTDNNKQNLKNALQGAVGAAALSGNALLNKVSGLNVYEIMQEVERDLKRGDLNEVGKEIYKEYSFKKDAYELLTEELAEYVNKLEHSPLIVFVDELDRARPDYSVKFLEAIKHLFPVNGICFVLAVDRDQLRASVEQLYGKVDFDNYYRRFITREANLPEAFNVNLTPYLAQLYVEYFNKKTQKAIRFPFLEQKKNQILEHIGFICQVFSLTPRQIEYLFRVFSQFMAVDHEKKIGKTSWIEASATLIALMIKNEKLYHSIGKGTIKPNELYNFIKHLELSSKHIERQLVYRTFPFILKEADGNDPYKEQIADIIIRYEYNELPETNRPAARNEMINRLAKQVSDFGDFSTTSVFEYSYSSLEEWKSFID